MTPTSDHVRRLTLLDDREYGFTIDWIPATRELHAHMLSGGGLISCHRCTNVDPAESEDFISLPQRVAGAVSTYGGLTELGEAYAGDFAILRLAEWGLAMSFFVEHNSDLVTCQLDSDCSRDGDVTNSGVGLRVMLSKLAAATPVHPCVSDDFVYGCTCE